MKELKWGILGPGKIARSFADDLALVEGATLHGVASRSLERAETFAEAYQVESAYGNYDALIQDSEIDILYIATPHDSHMEYAIKAMKAGKHVLCEKPLAVNSVQVEKMIAVSREQNVFLMEALWSRFNPSIIDVLTKLKAGEIGEIKYVNVDFSVGRNFAPESRMLNMELAGGSLLDMGIYPVFLSYMIFGMPENILATAQFHETGADIQTSAILQYQKGVAHILSGFLSDSEMIAKIHGETGRINIHRRWHEAQSYEIIKEDNSEVFNLPTIGRGYSYEIKESMSCIAQGLIESSRWSHKNSLELISILDEIRESIGLKYSFE